VALDASALVLRVGELDDFHRALSELVGHTQSIVLLRSLITILIAGLAVEVGEGYATPLLGDDTIY